MNRKLIFIINDGGPENFLPGVKLDFRHFNDFFLSDEGGAWEGNEIWDYSALGINRLREKILKDASQKQYLLIVFLGHGYTRGDDETMFELENGEDVSLSEIKNWTQNTRCLFIADSCRVKLPILEDGGRIPEIRMFAESGNTNHRNACKQLYNTRLRSLRQGSFTAGFATAFDEEAKENSNGGYYSSALLQSAKEFIGDKTTKGIASFSYIHAQARAKVQRLTDGLQNPFYMGGRFNVPPFIVKA